MGIYCLTTLIVSVIFILFWFIFEDTPEAYGIISLLIIFVLLVFWVGIYITHEKPDGYYEKSMVSKEYKIKTAKIDKDLYGKMIHHLDGFVKTESNYKYYIVSGDKHYNMKTSDCSTTTLIESNKEPKVIDYYFTKGYIEHSKIYRFFRGGEKIEKVNVNVYSHTELYIPEGTIIENYSNINL